MPEIDVSTLCDVHVPSFQLHWRNLKTYVDDWVVSERTLGRLKSKTLEWHKLNPNNYADLLRVVQDGYRKRQREGFPLPIPSDLNVYSHVAKTLVIDANYNDQEELARVIRQVKELLNKLESAMIAGHREGSIKIDLVLTPADAERLQRIIDSGAVKGLDIMRLEETLLDNSQSSLEVAKEITVPMGKSINNSRGVSLLKPLALFVFVILGTLTLAYIEKKVQFVYPEQVMAIETLQARIEAFEKKYEELMQLSKALSKARDDATERLTKIESVLTNRFKHGETSLPSRPNLSVESVSQEIETLQARIAAIDKKYEELTNGLKQMSLPSRPNLSVGSGSRAIETSHARIAAIDKKYEELTNGLKQMSLPSRPNLSVESGSQISYVEKTIMVPTQVTEMRTVTKNAYKMEARTRTYTVTKQIPRIEDKTSTSTVMVPKQETKQVSYTVNVPVTSQVEESYQVNVPSTVTEEVPYTVNETVYTDKVETYTVQVPSTVVEQVTYQVAVSKSVPEVQNYTVSVPSTVMETVNYTVQVPTYVDVVQTYNVSVPVTTQEQVSYTVQVPVYTDEQVPYTVQVPVYTDEVQSYTVKVPYTEQRTGMRQVCRSYPVTTMKTCTKDMGSYQTLMEEVAVGCRTASTGCGCATTAPGCGCGTLAPCGFAPAMTTRTVCKKVWVPNVVTQEVPVTTMQRQMVDEPYTYNVSLCRDEVRQRTVKKVSYTPETRTRTVKKCSMTTEPRTRTVNKVSYTTEARQRTVKQCQMNTETRQRQVAKTVYNTETRQRTVNKMVTEMEPRTRDVSKTVYNTESRTRTVKVPSVVPKQLTRTVSKVVYTPETRTRMKTVTNMITETKVRDVVTTVMVPEERTNTYNVTVYDTVNEEKTETYNVCVPYTTTEEVAVTVCKMVPQTVTVPVTTNGYGVSGAISGGAISGDTVESGCSSAPVSAPGAIEENKRPE